jgi:hypothetical protein
MVNHLKTHKRPLPYYTVEEASWLRHESVSLQRPNEEVGSQTHGVVEVLRETMVLTIEFVVF